MSKLKLIQVGIGGMGDTWVRTVLASSEMEYAAWVDIDRHTLEQQSQKYGFDINHCYTSLEQALERERADGLINVTPPAAHEAICMTALAAGLPVLTEKPLASSLAAAKRLVSMAEQAGLTLMVAQNYRYQPLTMTLHELISKKGILGQVGQVAVQFFKGPHFGGFREEMEFPLLVDMAIHHFDLMRYILGKDPQSVRGKSWNPPWSWFRGDASVALLFTFQEGLPVVYTGSWCAMGAETSWNGDWRIEGERGVLLSQKDQIYLGIPNKRELEKVPLLSCERTGQAYLLHEFFLALTEGYIPRTRGADNIKSLEMVFGAIEAVHTGNIVRLGDG